MMGNKQVFSPFRLREIRKIDFIDLNVRILIIIIYTVSYHCHFLTKCYAYFRPERNHICWTRSYAF